MLQRKCACGNHTVVGGECGACKQKREATLQRPPLSPAPVYEVPPLVHEVLRAPGQPLDTATRAFMEPRFGHDFSGVRVHTDAQAAESARAVNALAYTVGRDVVFGAGQYLPRSDAGQQLLAHGLTHDRGVPPTSDRANGAIQAKLTIGASNDPLEQEADRIADQVLAAPAHLAVSGALPRIQRFAGQPAGQTDTAPASVDRVLASLGQPLDTTLQQDMEQRFGYDFSQVRVHSGGAAEQSAREVNANAYTAGHDIVFGAGQFVPGTHEGWRLIAHELTHVVQQSRADGIRVGQSKEKRGRPPISGVATVDAATAPGVLQRRPKPANPKQAYADALVQINGIDATLYKYLSATVLNGGSKTVRTGTGVDNSTKPPTTVKFAFDLDVKHDSSLPSNTDAVFDSGVPSLSSAAGATSVFTASMTMKINPSATSASLATKLYHEGLHMILFMEEFLPSSPASPHTTAFANYNKIAKAHKDFATAVAEAEVFIDLDLSKRKVSQKGLAKKAADEMAAHLVEEKYVFDQEKVKFGTAFTNRQLAATYVMEGFKAFGVSASTNDKNVVSIFDKFAAVFDEIDKQTAPAKAAPKSSGSKPVAPKKP
jgi:uncharacterized protein DUF4157